MSNFPESPIDGALAEVANSDGSAVQYKYDKAEAAWKIVGKVGGGDLQVVTTKDVVTTSEPPLAPTGWTGFNVQEDIQYLTNQKLVNWFLAEQIIKNHNRPPILTPGEPIQHPELPGTPDLINGDTWVDGNNNIYIYLNGEWVGIVRSDDFIADQLRQDNTINELTNYLQGLIDSGSTIPDLFVHKTGDTMTGDLVMEDSRIVMVDGPIDFVQSAESLKDNNADPILDANGNEQWDPNEERFSILESYPPRLIKSNGTYSGDTSTPFGIKVEIDDGNTFRNQFKVGNRNGDAVTVSGGTGPQVIFGSGFPGNQDKVAPGDEGKVRIKGIPTPDYLTADDDVAVNKQYVDLRDEILQQEIIELEEEIDAIAPSVERGKWRFTAVGTVAQPGQFTMYDDEFGSGAPTGLFKSTKSIWFNETDSEGTAHAFGDVDDGELLEIFIDGSPEFGLYEVVGKAHDETQGATSFWVVDVNFIRTNEDTTAVAPSELCRFKIFMAPTGGDASSFVMKSGDNMEGSLDMKGQTGRNKIINLATPTTEFHAANKTYVDTLFNFNTYAELS